jgi:hypothetical protein
LILAQERAARSGSILDDWSTRQRDLKLLDELETEGLEMHARLVVCCLGVLVH